MTIKDDMNAALDEMLADMTEDTTHIDGFETYITGLKQQIADLMAAGTVDAATVTKVNNLLTLQKSNSAKIVEALNTNVTPPA